MKFKIRKASLEDIQQLGQLFDEYRVFYRQISHTARSTDFIKQRLLNNEADIFIATSEDKAIGFVQLYKLFHYIKLEKQWLLSDLYVQPAHRGKGVSLALIQRSKEWCIETGACGLMLETEKTNDISNTLYPRCGFILDQGHNYYHWWK
ncbi:GNAT family N-acetyltransferase [Myroides pelagicus]|uniref:GNAT family N-acetyltransferase n=1 Tax=Myroides pelagicus TaxID=270914 RepID=A0A7K1GJL8_9FLAO|nr:GNAT family N-acetyltransferase [Myroides pelagicus]MEC4113820.1 GNAT family N-acetyltransferase [Myroides pelagicus]MTH29072.1 GNAT family N-acetyltransferase [Myroides pelagicus]